MIGLYIHLLALSLVVFLNVSDRFFTNRSYAVFCASVIVEANIAMVSQSCHLLSLLMKDLLF